jgi:hypothetical protein
MPIIPEHLVHQVTTVGTAFSSCVELILGYQIQRCVANLHVRGVGGGGSGHEEMESALACITALALEGNNLCRLLVSQGALPALLALCQDSRPPAVRIAALRALGSICCVLEGIQGFLGLGGQERVVDILADRRRSEGERREAAGLLAQLTSPWIEGNTGFPGIELFLQEVIFSLKGNSYFFKLSPPFFVSEISVLTRIQILVQIGIRILDIFSKEYLVLPNLGLQINSSAKYEICLKNMKTKLCALVPSKIFTSK